MRVGEGKRLRPSAAFTLISLKMRFALILELALLLASAIVASGGGVGNKKSAISAAAIEKLKAKTLKTAGLADDLLSNDLFDRLWSAVGADDGTAATSTKSAPRANTDATKMEATPSLPTGTPARTSPATPAMRTNPFPQIDQQDLLQPMDKMQRDSQTDVPGSEEPLSEETQPPAEKTEEVQPSSAKSDGERPESHEQPEQQVSSKKPQPEEKEPDVDHVTPSQPPTEKPTEPSTKEATSTPKATPATEPEPEMTTVVPSEATAPSSSLKTSTPSRALQYPRLWPLTKMPALTAMSKKYLDNIRDLGPGPKPHLHQLARQADIDSMHPPPIGKSKRSATTSRSADADIYDVDNTPDENRPPPPQPSSNQGSADPAGKASKLKMALNLPGQQMMPTTGFPMTTQTMSMLDQLQIKLIAHSEAAARHKAMMSTRSLFTMPRLPITSISYLGGPLNRMTPSVYAPTPLPQLAQSRHFQNPVRNYPAVAGHPAKIHQQNMPHFVNLPSQEVPKVQDILMELEKENAAHLASLQSSKRGLSNAQSSLFGKPSQTGNTRFKKHASTAISFGVVRKATAAPSSGIFSVLKDGKKESRDTRSLKNSKRSTKNPSSGGRQSLLAKSTMKPSTSKRAMQTKKGYGFTGGRNSGQPSSPRSPPKSSTVQLTEVRMIGLPFESRSAHDSGSRGPVMQVAPKYTAGLAAPRMPEYSHHQSRDLSSKTISNKYPSYPSQQPSRYSPSNVREGPPVLSSKDSQPISDHLAAMMDQMAAPEETPGSYQIPRQVGSVERAPLRYESSIPASRGLDEQQKQQQQQQLPKQQQQKQQDTQVQPDQQNKSPDQSNSDYSPEYQTSPGENAEPTPPPAGKPLYINPAIVMSTQFPDDEPDNGKGMALPYERLSSPSAVAARVTTEALMKEIDQLRRSLRECENQHQHKSFFPSNSKSHREPLELFRASPNLASLFNAPPKKPSLTSKSPQRFRIEGKPKFPKDHKETHNRHFSNSQDTFGILHSHLNADVQHVQPSHKKQKDVSDDQPDVEDPTEGNRYTNQEDKQGSLSKVEPAEPLQEIPISTPMSESNEAEGVDEGKGIPEQQLMPTTNDHSPVNHQDVLLAASAHADSHSTRVAGGITNGNFKSGLGKRESKSSLPPPQKSNSTQQPVRNIQTTTTQLLPSTAQPVVKNQEVVKDSDEASFPAGKSSMDALRNDPEEAVALSNKNRDGRTWNENTGQNARGQVQNAEGNVDPGEEGGNFDMGSDSMSAEEEFGDENTGSEVNHPGDQRAPSSLAHTATPGVIIGTTAQALNSKTNIVSQAQQAMTPAMIASTLGQLTNPAGTLMKGLVNSMPVKHSSVAAMSTQLVTKFVEPSTGQRLATASFAQIPAERKILGNNEVKLTLPSSHQPAAPIIPSTVQVQSTLLPQQTYTQQQLFQKQTDPVGTLPSMMPSSQGQLSTKNIASAAQPVGQVSQASPTMAPSVGHMMTSRKPIPMSRSPMPMMNSHGAGSPPVPPPPMRRRKPEDRMGTVLMPNEAIESQFPSSKSPIGTTGAKPGIGLKPRSAKTFGSMPSSILGKETQPKLPHEGEPPAEK